MTFTKKEDPILVATKNRTFVDIGTKKSHVVHNDNKTTTLCGIKIKSYTESYQEHEEDVCSDCLDKN